MKAEVLTGGYVSMDHIIKLNTPARAGFTSIVKNKTGNKLYYGGCSVNIAYELCKLGICAMPLIRVGDDYESSGFKEFLEEAHVPTEGITGVKGEVTGYSYLLLDNNNDHITLFYPGAMSGTYSSGFNKEFFTDIKLGVITVASVEDNLDFFEKCRAAGVPIVFGMKDDFEAFPPSFLNKILEESKIIFANEVECEIIKKIKGLSDIKELFDMGKAKIVVVTLGAKGSICYIKQGDKIVKKRIDALKVEKIVDTSGGGDAYMAGFLYGYIKGYKPEECCRLGSVLASYIIQEEGCLSNVPDETKLLRDFNCFKD